METWPPRSLSTLRARRGHTTKLEVAGDHGQIAPGCPQRSVCLPARPAYLGTAPVSAAAASAPGPCPPGGAVAQRRL